MKREPLLFGLAAVLAGIATLEFVLAFVYTPALFAIAVPFGVAAYLVWYHASGRLHERVVSGRAGSYRRADPETGGFGAGPRDSFTGRRGFDADGGFDGREARDRRARGAAGGRGGRGRRRAQTVGDTGPTPAEAYRVLGLDGDADADDVRQAYRQKVKSVHPDRESGDEEQFKRVKEAYEVLNDRN
ncbi:DnaJ domain-containing protein [Halorussus gelatinilyticus]|uniref:DnaJ domain-containing protein n=1 Tax=Halorussus gelatinilyticus TaxID=2937524 RepID=A0A8U0ILC1_9EURY|nr:DnaJ domain-containing protein [Halorussus gelatinilyticus]UPW01132.1 DnaJ domain-containing protein [Halorussus gelatinilyticus]